MKILIVKRVIRYNDSVDLVTERVVVENERNGKFITDRRTKIDPQGEDIVSIKETNSKDYIIYNENHKNIEQFYQNKPYLLCGVQSLSKKKM